MSSKMQELNRDLQICTHPDVRIECQISYSTDAIEIKVYNPLNYSVIVYFLPCDQFITGKISILDIINKIDIATRGAPNFVRGYKFNFKRQLEAIKNNQFTYGAL